MNGDRLIRAATAAVVTAFAAVVSYSHVYDLGRTHGQSGAAAQLLPTTGPGKTRLPEAETDDGEPHSSTDEYRPMPLRGTRPFAAS